MDKKKDLLILAVGGTGGHLYPAQALAQELKQKNSEMDFLFLGCGLSSNFFFNQKAFSYVDISSGVFFIKKPWMWLKTSFCLIKGIFQSVQILKAKKPTLVIGFGSFHSFPILVATYLLKIPYILFESNAVLGKVNQLFAKKAKHLAYQFFDVELEKNIKAVKVTMPILQEKRAVVSQKQAREKYGLDPTALTLLVFGGSQGALSLNHAVLAAMPLLKKQIEFFQIIHLIGFNTDVNFVKNTYLKLGISAYVGQYEEKMSDAYSAADALIARAGSNTIAEQLLFKLPTLFIPYPYLKDQHQNFNAQYIAKQVQGAFVIEHKEMTPQKLADRLQKLIENISPMKLAIDAFQKRKQDLPLVDLVIHTLEKITC
ncbi:MAG: UDP-N-acetylglucosamine--N-acetylmuramyl-(pentapeptide) pyrophosphoryl-undecaprenol N-acetylglucosamine transferase [Chlamydiota bacterium]